MSGFAVDWLNLLIRWAHLIAGIGWIGTSFYFVALDLSLKKREKMNPGVYGTAWEVHGGGFYHVEKFLNAPEHLPGDLIWYKWEAYLTWITGFLLMVVQFYLYADLWLIDPDVMALEPWQAIGISVASLVIGWLIYDGLCRSPIGKNTPLLAGFVFLLILAAAYFYTNVFSARSSLVHVGAFIGTIMAVNVFGIIVPNQKKITASLLAGEAPDAKFGIIGKQRSTHNTYLTLPVLVMMVSGHYAMLTGHPQSWILVGLIVIMGAMARHFLLRHEVGDPMNKIGWMLPVIAVVLVAAMWMTAPKATGDRAGAVVSDATVMALSQKYCVTCHAASPTNDAFEEAPKNVRLETLDELRRYSSLIIKQTVETDVMPLGNELDMTQDERQQLGAWLAQQ
ncbi:FIG137887: membrane protein related to purine degradation [hydrothermal vent metagenome]|uniref:FIG137887: membrane protein related to purine degradation n=1 Tax=hydrothermal vent metagenome TaxID=652676 RepID=A0A3B0RWU8_9ZZZZ